MSIPLSRTMNCPKSIFRQRHCLVIFHGNSWIPCFYFWSLPWILGWTKDYISGCADFSFNCQSVSWLQAYLLLELFCSTLLAGTSGKCLLVLGVARVGWTNFSKSSQIEPIFLHSMCIGDTRSHTKFQVSDLNILMWRSLFVNQSWHWESHMRWPKST